MRHPLDHVIASDLSQEVLQARRLRGEYGPCALDSVNRRLYSLPCVLVQRERFTADRHVIGDEDELPVSGYGRRRQG